MTETEDDGHQIIEWMSRRQGHRQQLGWATRATNVHLKTAIQHESMMMVLSLNFQRR